MTAIALDRDAVQEPLWQADSPAALARTLLADTLAAVGRHASM
jgi:hypothetical protein